MLPKLVRDKIPSNIVKDGKIPVCEFVDDATVESYIFNKIKEEVAELQYECTGPLFDHEKIVEEFADVFEVLMKLAELYGVTLGEINIERVAKAQRCGFFQQNIILKDITLKGEEKNNGKI